MPQALLYQEIYFKSKKIMLTIKKPYVISQASYVRVYSL